MAAPLSHLSTQVINLDVVLETYKLHVHRLRHEEDILMAMLDPNSKQVQACDTDIESKWLESQLKCILKQVERLKVVETNSHLPQTYLLLYLVDDLIGLTPHMDTLSARGQRLLLQCIVKVTQKIRDVAHFVIRSSSCII